MKTFKDYLAEAELPSTRKYVAVYYDSQTQTMLEEYCRQNGFDLTKSYSGEDGTPEEFRFHTTVFYTTTEHKIPDSEKPIEGSVIPVGFELFGEDKNIPVLIVESDRLNEIRAEFEQRYRMKDEWPEYRPHISLSYAKDNIPDIHSVRLPDFELTFDTIKIESLKD
jgi:hypothetical protein